MKQKQNKQNKKVKKLKQKYQKKKKKSKTKTRNHKSVIGHYIPANILNLMKKSQLFILRLPKVCQLQKLASAYLRFKVSLCCIL